jgi:hypothetical protein
MSSINSEQRMFNYVISAEIVLQFVLMLMMFSSFRENRCDKCRWVLKRELKLRWNPGFVIIADSVLNNAPGKQIPAKQ